MLRGFVMGTLAAVGRVAEFVPTGVPGHSEIYAKPPFIHETEAIAAAQRVAGVLQAESDSLQLPPESAAGVATFTPKTE